MTSIQFGGGRPSTQERRNFTGLKEGVHLPGYKGYCPTMKYRIGQTYGHDTHDISNELQVYRSATLMPAGSLPATTQSVPALPSSTGDNKYTKDMVPGYTGYIPASRFKFGHTYKAKCDVCIGEHMDKLQKFYSNADMSSDLAKQHANKNKLAPIKSDNEVKTSMDTYRGPINHGQSLVEDKRPLTEAPMPGYQGYVPRVGATELGLGVRYHTASKNGFQALKADTERVEAIEKAPISVDRIPTSNGPAYSRRLYVKIGMLPKYTGYIPEKRFLFGKTYGNATRAVDVCAHDMDAFGDYMKVKTNLAKSTST